MIINSIAELCVQYDEPLNLVRVAWTAGSSMRHFQQAFTQLHDIMRQLAVGRIVLELNAMPDIPVYDQMWMSSNFMPGLLKLPLQQVVVVLSARRVYNQHVVEGVLSAAAMHIKFDVQFFTQADTAMAWLTDDSLRLPWLLREWAGSCGRLAPPSDEVTESPPTYEHYQPKDCQPDS